MKIVIVSDAWFPQMNGVVRTFSSTINELSSLGHSVETITPGQFATIPCPTYPEIKLALPNLRQMEQLLSDPAIEAIHIATEGPLGLAARQLCIKSGRPFTTSFTTRFPEYIHKRFLIPSEPLYKLLCRFHAGGNGLLVATDSLKEELQSRGFPRVKRWRRGVDTDLFRPQEKPVKKNGKPILMYVGRVAIEKNIEAFLDLRHPGQKIVVGSGPQLEILQRQYPQATFTGPKSGTALAALYAEADVLVFPSKTDTFGLVMLEALACGTPVAAFPVPGPLDVVGKANVGALDDNLDRAVAMALDVDIQNCRAYALDYSWRKVAEEFLALLVPFNSPAKPQIARAA